MTHEWLNQGFDHEASGDGGAEEEALGWGGAEEAEEDPYTLPGYAEDAGEQYRVEIALEAAGRWAEVDRRDLASAELTIESLLTVLLQIFPSFAVLSVRVRRIVEGMVVE